MIDWTPVATGSIAALAALVASALTYFFTIRTTTRQFEHEVRIADRQDQAWIDQQWWHRKADTYAEIIEILRKNQIVAEAIRDQYLEAVKNDRLIHDLQLDVQERRVKLQNQRSSGAFYISADAAEAIDRYFKDQANVYWDGLEDEIAEEQIAINRTCLDAVREAALTDLRVSANR